MKEEDRITRAVGVCKKVVQHSAHSWKKRNSLTEAQVAKGLPHHTLVTNCPTRWGSQHKMISRILEQDAAIRRDGSGGPAGTVLAGLLFEFLTV